MMLRLFRSRTLSIFPVVTKEAFWDLNIEVIHYFKLYLARVRH